MDFFCPFTFITTWKIKILKKFKKNPWRYYHFTQVYHKLKSYMYCSWDMKHERQNFLSFWAIFCPFIPLTTQKIKVLKKKKKTPGDIIFTKNQDHMPYWSLDMPFDGCNMYCSSWTVFWTFIPLTARKTDRPFDGQKKRHIETGASSKSLVKPLKIAVFWPNLQKNGFSMGHVENEKQNFLQKSQKQILSFQILFIL